jgi:HAD superfamily hydrolase (TIGR01509 family)
MRTLQALLFDVDGTLADTERAHLETFNQAFALAGLTWHWSERLYVELLAVTGGKERIRHYIDRYLPEFTPPGDRDAFIATLHAEKTRLYLERVVRGALDLRPGVARLLREGRREGLRLAIATTTTPANVTALLESTLGPASASWFEVIGAGDTVPRKKPAPDIYQHVLAQMRLDPADCVAFEDSGSGLRAARAAGLATIVAVNPFTRDHDFEGAALVVDSFGEPGQPFTVLQGDAGGKTYLDLELVRQVRVASQSR